jgi:oxepin-CoA hydrolase/3-oxo-5,6-dehydrosuberyl-CoA semialdehyde dehydrogenase
MAVVRSYITGRWFAPDSGTAVYDAATGELVAEVSSAGVDEITVTLTCKQISPRAGDYGEVRWDAELTNAGGTVVATYDVLTMVAKEWDA